MRSDDGGPAIAPFDKLRVSGSGAIALRSVAAMALHLRETMAAEMFDAWAATAQPGAMQIYGMGIDAHSASGPGVAVRMRELSEAGLVVLHLLRARPGERDYPIDFIVVRSKKPVPKGFPELPSTIAPMFNRVGKVGGK